MAKSSISKLANEEEATKGQSGKIEKKTQTGLPKFVPAEELFARMQGVLDRVARRAYEIFENDGRGFGRDWENWFEAESEFLHPVHLDIVEAENALTVRAEVPGFNADQIEVSVEPRRLTISGKRESRSEQKKGRMVYSDRCSNQFLRVVNLPADVDADKVSATLNRGILELEIPKAAPPKKVSIASK
ncbi:MAG: Hsp20 family protein [Acidobacteria bacterium]|nr:Hsp20 family protein [Acidobacteriota bacterium]